MDIVDSKLLHCLMIVFVLSLVALIIVARKKLRTNNKQFSYGLGYFTLCLWLVYNVYNFLSDSFEVGESLPLHVCDVLAVVSVLVLLTRNGKASSFLYFCALPLASQAILTPTGEQNPLLFRFWLFWLLHASIIVTFVYDLVVRKFSPSFKNYLQTIGFDLLYILIILPINILFNFNYGFIGNSAPDVPTMVDVFGEWPIRVVWMFLAVVLVQLVMYLPWYFINKKSISSD